MNEPAKPDNGAPIVAERGGPPSAELQSVLSEVETEWSFRQRSFHLTGVLILVFLLYPAGKRDKGNRPSFIDWILILASVLAGAYIFASYASYAFRGGQTVSSDYF